MRTLLLAAVAAFSLAACNQAGGGPALPRVQEGAVAPSELTRPSSGVQQVQVTAEVREQLTQYIGQQLDQMQNASGLTPVADGQSIQPMQPGTDHRMVLPLTAGTPYTFVGACDNDCNNVDIELISMTTGGVVASDMLPDDFPIVNYVPTENGEYMVRLILQTCTQAPCFAGARALSGAAGGGAPAQPEQQQGAASDK
jgi:hypothetical protein